MAREMEIVCRALAVSGVHLAGEDQAESARQLREIVHSPLRTLVENGQRSAERVLKALRAAA